MKQVNHLYGDPKPSFTQRWLKRLFYIFAGFVGLTILLSIVGPPLNPEEELEQAREEYRVAFELAYMANRQTKNWNVRVRSTEQLSSELGHMAKGKRSKIRRTTNSS
ncbi:MAG: hypothetical protein OXG15_12545 [Gammaproteobacteria bacterium]|nr:hypothetical protein [Gammaproteobacteria bacterium]